MLPPASRFALLDGLRGLAALAVVSYHVNPAYLPGAHLAVDFFFCLSGFVIALNYRQRLRAGAMGFWRFVGLRLARLYPMLLVGGGLAMWLLHTGPRILLLIPETWNRALFPGNPPFWSLLAEVAACIVFAVLLVRVSWRWAALVALAAAVGLVLLVDADPRADIYGLGETGAFWPGLWPGALRALAGFTLGTLLYALWQRLGAPRGRGWSALLIPLALLVVLALNPAEKVLWDLAAALILLPAIAFAAVCRELPWTRICTVLGDLSYPLYCIHVPILYAVGRMDGPKLLVAAGLVPLAWLLDHWYDRPARKWLARLVWLRGRPAASPALA